MKKFEVREDGTRNTVTSVITCVVKLPRAVLVEGTEFDVMFTLKEAERIINAAKIK